MSAQLAGSGAVCAPLGSKRIAFVCGIIIIIIVIVFIVVVVVVVDIRAIRAKEDIREIDRERGDFQSQAFEIEIAFAPAKLLPVESQQAKKAKLMLKIGIH